MNRQDPKCLFHEGTPKNLNEAYKEVMIATFWSGTDTIGSEVDKVRTARHRAEQIRAGECHLEKRRPCQNASFVDEFFFVRMPSSRAVRTTTEADDYTRFLLNSLYDPTKAIECQSLMHFPMCCGKDARDWMTREYLVLPKSELDPVRTLQTQREFLEWDQVNIQFAMWQLLQLCSEILTDVLDELRDDAELGERVRKGEFKEDPIYLVAYLIAYAAGEEDLSRRRPNTPRVRLAQLKRLYAIMQKYYLREDVTKPVEKIWVGDTCITVH
jgi:hypothetical protein